MDGGRVGMDVKGGRVGGMGVEGRRVGGMGVDGGRVGGMGMDGGRVGDHGRGRRACGRHGRGRRACGCGLGTVGRKDPSSTVPGVRQVMCPTWVRHCLYYSPR
ncbi:hypothetical protein Pmani_020533 [Petrolisthes manimaculis]|uniref:Uncharacterized protein n=1 Tax=Petrolisthes manimaculis TaxID=1843537 RepID=A0AAE1U2Z3_9EUCA|nr:hypothetical protein Pmani_020533 [Petrolisthes manimaculis]